MLAKVPLDTYDFSNQNARRKVIIVLIIIGPVTMIIKYDL